MKQFIQILQCGVITTILLLAGCAHPPNTTRLQHTENSVLSASQLNQTNVAPQHIALLLPLTGPYASYANAIRNGFFTAFYDQKRLTGYTPTISVVNTANKNIHDIVQATVAQGTDFIIGPLDKSDVLALTTFNSSVPILALNTTLSSVRNDNNKLYEYGLSPADETLQIAMKAWQQNHRNIIILAPNNAYGKRVVETFAAQWKNLGGNIVAIQYYGGMTTLSKSISTVLQVNRAYKNERKLQNMFHENMRFIPQRRQDFDSLFLVANPEMGRQIEPLLRFYFAGNIPTYATSAIFSENHDQNANQDLNGILFCSIPWIVAPYQMPTTLQSLRQRIQALWPDNATSLGKFYAMGIDAFHLAVQFKNMQSNPQLGMPAATGTLYLTTQHTVYRQLTWVQFQNGQPQVIN